MNQGDFDSIRQTIIDYVVDNHLSEYDRNSLPRDQSLVEIGVIDSFGVVELISFLEKTWALDIDDAEVTKENLGSIDKTGHFILSKLAKRALA
jgi:acyl carrier protein